MRLVDITAWLLLLFLRSAGLQASETAGSAISTLPPITSIINLTTWESIIKTPEFLLALPGIAERNFEHPNCNEFVMDKVGNLFSVRKSDKWPRYPSVDAYREAREGKSIFGYYLCYYGNTSLDMEMSYREGCVIPESQLCDNYTTCLTDECDCGVDTFLCGDGNGCISRAQVCDGRVNCLDFSDECACHDFQTCKKSPSFDPSKCFLKPDCVSPTYTAEIIYQEFRPPNDSQSYFANNMVLKLLDEAKVELCKINETNLLSFHCKRIKFHPLKITSSNTLSFDYPRYMCDNNSGVSSVLQISVERHKVVFCDGLQQCDSGIDEQSCPDTFYCKSDNKAIPMNMTCDSVADCLDSSDECNNCAAYSTFSSQNNLLSGKVLPYIVILLTLCIVCLNVYAVYHHFHDYDSNAKPAIRVDKIQCIILAGYDLFTALYLGMILGANFTYYGEYCLFDVTWRTSFACRAAGTIFFAASQGALQVTVAMSICRCFTCLNSLSDKEITVSGFLVVFLLVNLGNVVRAFTPLFVTSAVFTNWADIFIHEHIFTGNPLISRGKKIDLAMVLAEYKRVSLNETSSWSTKKLLDNLRNMTSHGQLFAPDYVKSIGFYGRSSMCFPDFFTNEPAMLGYKIFFMTESSSYIITILSCYVLILRQYIKSRATVQPAGQKDDGNQNQVFFLSVKISLLIGSQILCWLPVTVAIIGSFFDWAIPFLKTDGLIGLIIPINSFLDPILHCKPMFNRASSIIERICHAVQRIPSLLSKENKGSAAVVPQSALENVEVSVRLEPVKIESPAPR